MKIKLAFVLFFLLHLTLSRLDAQSIQRDDPGQQLKSCKSMLFGKDILINDKSSQNQRAGAMCSAFNGWLYAIYSHNAGDSCNWTIMDPWIMASPGIHLLMFQKLLMITSPILSISLLVETICLI